MTFNEIYEYYHEIKKSTRTQRSYDSIVSIYNVHIKNQLGDKDISALKYLDYQNFANNLLKTKSVKTVKNILIVLKGLIKLAIKNDFYDDKNYIDYIELPQFDNKCYFTLNVELQQAYIKAILNHDEYPFSHIFIFLLHGRRLSEVLNLSWNQIDLNDKIMYLHSSKNKSKKNLSFMLTDIQLQILQHHYDLAVKKQKKVFIDGYVFINTDTNNQYKDIRKAFKRMLDKNNLSKIRIHDIRHLVATYLINHCKLSIEVVSQTLGHSDIKITQRYLNQSPSNSKFAIDTLFESIKNSA